MSFCINLKQKMNRTLYCKKLNKQITFKDCSSCPFKVYQKPTVSGLSNKKADSKMQQRNLKNNSLQSYSNLRAKSEYKYRPKKGKCSNYYNDVSIMPPSTLYHTKKTKGCQKHHIFGGVANRPKSEKYGLFIWLTPEQHDYLHNHQKEMLGIKKEAQMSFMKYYNKTVDEFIEVFGRSWL